LQSRKPAWWQLYALVPLMIGLVVIEHLDPLPGVPAKVVDAGIVVLTFGAMLVWVHFNGGLVEYYEMQRDESLRNLKITIYDPQSDTMKDVDASNLWTPSMLSDPANAFAVRWQGEDEDTEKWSLN
jgi:hypothetical protein